MGIRAMADFKKLTKIEIEKFIKDNQHGILSMAGDKPYALPMGYMYKRKTFLLGLVITGGMSVEGRKMKYLTQSKKICFTICRPRWFMEKLKKPCTTLVLEGELVEVTNPAYFGVKTMPSGVDMKLYKIKTDKIGARKCNRKPCELFAGKKLLPRRKNM